MIKDYLINSSCNGIRLIGPATRLTIANHLFRGPCEQPHRTSRELHHTNMLSGIILQHGAWDATRGPLDDVLLANNVMQHVASPVTLWTKPGNTVGKVTASCLNARPLSAWGLYARNVEHLTLGGVRFSLASDELQSVVHADRV